jgi:hypothetical protein
MPTDLFGWFKLIAPLLTGGLIGALVTAYFTDRRNRVQPINRKISVSYVDVPAVMQGYNSVITLSGITDGETKTHHFQKLAIVQIELTNTGNKDIDSFDFGINLPIGTTIIGVQHASQDRYHEVGYTPKITIDKPSNEVDVALKPFNRKDKYNVTLVASTEDSSLDEKIEMSKRLSVRFVDADVVYTTVIEILLGLLKGSISVAFPFASLTIERNNKK